MAVTKISNSSLKNLNKYDSFLAGNEAYDPGATYLIERITASSTASTITFSSIPTTYKHLQIRAVAIGSINNQAIVAQVGNGSVDTASNYSYHYLQGDSSSVGGGGAASTSYMYLGYSQDQATGLYPWSAIVDILDYANTNKYKTLRSLNGWDSNGVTGQQMRLHSGSWRSTAAVNTITISSYAGNPPSGSATGGFAAKTTFALYGIKG